jgi:hypothetical protein
MGKQQVFGDTHPSSEAVAISNLQLRQHVLYVVGMKYIRKQFWMCVGDARSLCLACVFIDRTRERERERERESERE